MALKILLVPRRQQRRQHSGKSQYRISWTVTVSCAAAGSVVRFLTAGGSSSSSSSSLASQ
jgi:hypothetical protein